MIEKYNVKLKLLDQEDIELVRTWRNDPKISNFLVNQTHITEEMQRTWFNNLDRQFNHYFVIVSNFQKVGLINLKNINLELKNGEVGIFIAEELHQNSILAFQATCGLLDYAFEELMMYSVYAYIFDWNKRAIRFNEALGYQHVESNEDRLQLYSLSKENYTEKSVWIKNLMR